MSPSLPLFQTVSRTPLPEREKKERKKDKAFSSSRLASFASHPPLTLLCITQGGCHPQPPPWPAMPFATRPCKQFSSGFPLERGPPYLKKKSKISLLGGPKTSRGPKTSEKPSVFEGDYTILLDNIK